MTKFSRRECLKNAILSVGGATVALGTLKASTSNCNILTPSQTEGPFYPIKDQNDKDNDLTISNASPFKALGEVIKLKGVVIDDLCHPVQSAVVEIWQACATGKYNHPGDSNTAKLDPHFQYWGRAITNSKGEYSFKTILPGNYPATNEWTRPAHIHLKVHRRGYEELTTQIYFEGDKYNSKDKILQSLSVEEQNKVIVKLQEQTDIDGSKLDVERFCVFNISIKEF